MGEKDEILGVCTCGNKLWEWKIKEGVMILTCVECGKEAHFTCPFPMLNILADSGVLNNSRIL